MKTAGALILLAALVNAANAHGGDSNTATATATTSASAKMIAVGQQKVEVVGTHVKAKDILGLSAADVDLGASPPIGSSRVIDRAEIERAFVSASLPAPKKIPASVRVTRKTKKLSAPEVVSAIRTALSEKPLPRNSTLAAVRANATEISADFDHVKVELPAMLPRRAGSTTVQAIVTFVGEGDATLHKSVVPLDIIQPPEAAFAEIQRGAPISIVVRRGLVEVSMPATAMMDADVGSVIQVTIKPSGRVLRARAIDKTHAVALEES